VKPPRIERIFAATSFVHARVVVDRAAALAELSFALSATCSAKDRVSPCAGDRRWTNYAWSTTNGELVGFVIIGATQ
jgi:hypothetical protein